MRWIAIAVVLICAPAVAFAGKEKPRMAVVAEAGALFEGDTIIGRTPRGSLLDVLEERGDWALVRWQNDEGKQTKCWIHRQEIMPCEQAFAFFNREIERVPSAENIAARGIIQGNLGQRESAVADLTEAIRLNPKLQIAWGARAINRLGMGKADEVDKAIGDANEAIRLDPKDTALYGTRGAAWLVKGHGKKAMADFDTVVKLDPDRAAVYSGRGYTWLAQGKIKRAIEEFEKGAQIDPTSAELRNNCGLGRMMNGDYKNAEKDFSEAIRLDPEYVTAYSNRAAARGLEGRTDDALSDLNQAILLDPKSASAFSNRGMTMCAARDFAGAIHSYEKAMQLDPDDASDLQSLAWLLSTVPDPALRNAKRATDLARRACELTKWNDAVMLDTLAAAHAEAGDCKSAKEWEAKAIGLADSKQRKDFRKRMKLYEAGKPYRISAEEDAPRESIAERLDVLKLFR